MELILDFFKGRNFKILLAVLVVMIGFMLRSAAEGTTAVLFSQALSSVMTPFTRVGTEISNSVGGFVGGLLSSTELRKENDKLKEDLAELTGKLVEFERYKGENKQLREFLSLKDDENNLELVPALVIGRNTGESFYSFAIDRGTRDDVSLGDPVVTSLGLVGIVSEVSYSSAKVTTILDASMKIGVMESATSDIGIVTGEVALATEGKTKLTYLPRESAASVGDLVITSGVGGVFPKDLVVGKISAISAEMGGLSLFAEITPLNDIRTISNVLVITDFDGQREQAPKS